MQNQVFQDYLDKRKDLVDKLIEIKKENNPYYVKAITNIALGDMDYDTFLRISLEDLMKKEPFQDYLRQRTALAEKIVKIKLGNNPQAVKTILNAALGKLNYKRFSYHCGAATELFQDNVFQEHLKKRVELTEKLVWNSECEALNQDREERAINPDYIEEMIKIAYGKLDYKKALSAKRPALVKQPYG